MENQEPKFKITNKPAKEKKSYHVKFSTVIFLFIIALLIVGILYLYFASSANINTNTLPDNDISSTNLNLDIDDNTIDNNVPTTIELDIDDGLTKHLSQKVNFPGYVVSNLVETGGFDLNSEPLDNQTILNMGWGLAYMSDMYNNSAFMISSTNNVTTEKSLLVGDMENVIDYIFGKDHTYVKENFSLKNIDTFPEMVNELSSVNLTTGDIYAESYTATVTGEVENFKPTVYQEFEKIEKTDDTVKLYVKIGFCKPITIDSKVDTEIYKNYSNGNFEELVYTDKSYSLYEHEDKFLVNPLRTTPNYEEAFDKLDSYVYTFEFDENEQDYFLTKFNKVI